MFVHVVMFGWRAETTEEDIERASRTLTDLFRETPGLASHEMGSDLGLVSGQFGAEMGLVSEKADYCVIMRFEDQAAWQTYNSDPVHRKAVRESIGRLAVRRISVQFQA